MTESPVWIFLFGILSVYPFFPMRHIPILDRLKIPFWKLFFYATIIMIIQGFTFLWIAKYFPFASVALSWHRKIFMIPYIVLTCTFAQDKPSKTLFVDFLMVGIVMAVIDLSYILDRTLFADYFKAAPYATDVLVRSSLTFLTYPLLYNFFKKKLNPVMKIKTGNIWLYLTSIPFIFAIISITTTMEAFSHEISPVILSIRFSIIIGSVLVCFLLSALIKQMEVYIAAEEKSNQVQRLLQVQSEQYVALSNYMEQSKFARHDLRHHLAMIAGMIENDEKEKLREFIIQYQKSVLPERNFHICENYAANSIISHYLAIAEDSQIGSLDVKCVLQQNIFVDKTDICVLIGNILENAIEGCMTIPQEYRKIKFRMAEMKNEILITSDNSFDGIVKKAAKDTENSKLASQSFQKLSQLFTDDEIKCKSDYEYISRKRNDNQKGIGLSSVFAVVEKYNGKMRIEQQNNIFMVSISLKEMNTK